MADIRHFYKDTTSGVFLIDGNAIPGGKYNMLFYSSDTIVELVDVTNNQVILGPIEIVNLRKENDAPYTDKADLLADVAELFESGGGGGAGISDTPQIWDSEIVFNGNYGSFNENAHEQTGVIEFTIDWTGALFGAVTNRIIVSNGDAMLFDIDAESINADGATGSLNGNTFTPEDGVRYRIIFECSDVANQKHNVLIMNAPVITWNPPVISNFRIESGLEGRIYFDSSEIITASTYGGFTILTPSNTITGIVINTGQLTGHYFIVNTNFTPVDIPTIAYSGSECDIENVHAVALDVFSAVPITNNLAYEALLYDTFTDTDGTLIADHTPEVGSAGFSYSGSQQIENNRLKRYKADGRASWNVGVADLIMEFYHRNNSLTAESQFHIRWTDIDNRISIYWNATLDRIYIAEVIGGTIYTLGYGTLINDVNWHKFKFIANSTNVQVYVDDALIVNQTVNVVSGNIVGITQYSSTETEYILVNAL